MVVGEHAVPGIFGALVSFRVVNAKHDDYIAKYSGPFLYQLSPADTMSASRRTVEQQSLNKSKRKASMVPMKFE